MKEVARLLNEMQAAGVILSYAVFGAVAQMRYTEPVVTFDFDVLVEVPRPDRLDVLSEIFEFCKREGFQAAGPVIQVGNWPVQFVPAYDALTREALARAERTELEGVPIVVVSANYLAAIAIATGRSKDHERILALLQTGFANSEELAALARRHGLWDAWERFQKRFGIG